MKRPSVLVVLGWQADRRLQIEPVGLGVLADGSRRLQPYHFTYASRLCGIKDNFRLLQGQTSLGQLKARDSLCKRR